MSKDPAILFYTSDFLTGTMLMNDQQVGKYIRTICLIHQSKGILDRPSFDAFVIDPIVRAKFQVSQDGVTHHRVTEEMEKRSSYSASRSKNRKGNKDMSNICKSHDQHMENANAIEDEVVNTTKHNNTTKAKKPVSFVKDNPPTLKEVQAYCIERMNGIDAQAFIDKNTTIGWLDKNKIPYRDWKAVIRTWENYRKVTAIISPAGATKRPVAIVVVERMAAGRTSHEILHELVGLYTEHDINEALMQVKGEKV